MQAHKRNPRMILAQSVMVKIRGLGAQSADPRFAQDNPQMVLIQGSHMTYTHAPIVR